jgi:succinate-semialdehyde dehydrogenase/glutarate-semialdehyde dehydrogenase
MEKGLLYINGVFMPSETNQFFEVENPYTQEIIGYQADATNADIERCIDGCVKAFETFKRTTAYQRSKQLRKLAELMQSHEDRLARLMTLEQGKPLAEALGEVRYAASYVQWYSEEALRIKGDILEPHVSSMRLAVLREPIGPVAIITPWNFPLAMFVRKMAPALAAGCTVIVKPAEQTPLTAVAFFELVHEVGFAPGVCQLITGDAATIGGAFMASEAIRKLSFTGSTEVGQLLASQAGKTLKKLSLELGGHAPLIVFEDADLDLAVQGTLDSKFRNCGQVCIATNRVLVQRSVATEFTRLLKDKVMTLSVGNGFDKVDMGPIIDKNGYQKIQTHVDDAIAKGATCIVGGKGFRQNGDEGGYIFPPTVLTQVTEDMRIAYEETFGPVVPIMVFDTEEEAIAIANNTPYGLSAYFFTEGLSRANRVSEALEYGMVGVNTGRISSAQVPFGGVKMSGYGREGGTYGIDEYLQLKYIGTSIRD